MNAIEEIESAIRSHHAATGPLVRQYLDAAQAQLLMEQTYIRAVLDTELPTKWAERKLFGAIDGRRPHKEILAQIEAVKKVAEVSEIIFDPDSLKIYVYGNPPIQIPQPVQSSAS